MLISMSILFIFFHKWDHSNMCFFVSLSIMVPSFLHVVLDSFLWSNNTPLYGYTTFCLYFLLLTGGWIFFQFLLISLCTECTVLCNHHLYLVANISSPLKGTLHLLLIPPSPKPWQLLIFFLSPQI